jgi:multisubunit Na+/H+ antiporter MnhC subunit
VRGGAIPLLAWGTLLLVLYIGNWVWDGTGVNPAVTGLAVLLIYAGAVALTIRAGRRAGQTGPPEPERRPRAEPQASTGAALAALALASIVFGFTFGSFITYFGAGLLLIALGRLVVERRAQRRSIERAEEGWR